MEFGTFTRQQAARFLNISLPMLDAFIHRNANPLPSIRVGRKYLIPRMMLEEWLRAESVRGGDQDV